MSGKNKKKKKERRKEQLLHGQELPVNGGIKCCDCVPNNTFCDYSIPGFGVP